MEGSGTCPRDSTPCRDTDILISTWTMWCHQQHRRTQVRCCRQGRMFPVLHKNPAGTGSSTQAALPSSGAPWMWLNSTRPGARNEHNSSFLQQLPASSWVFYLKSTAINSSYFWRHSASPWQAPEQGAASSRGWLMDAHQLFCLLQEECSEECLSAQSSSEMQLCFTALNGP